MEISHSLCPALFTSSSQKTRKTHWKRLPIHLSARVYFSSLLSVLTSPPLSADGFPTIPAGIEKPTTPLHIVGPATTNSRVSLDRRLPDSNSCKTEKPQIQSTETINANTADVLIRELRKQTSEFECPYFWILL